MLPSEHSKGETFNEMVTREINNGLDDDGDMEKLKVIKSMGQIVKGGSEESLKKRRKDEYIDMGTIDKIREYNEYKKKRAADSQRKEYTKLMVKDGCEEADNNIQLDEKALQRMFNKDDFKQLKVCGQFNKGFIMTTMHESDLFILDQHACDEKFNFETFSRSAVIET